MCGNFPQVSQATEITACRLWTHVSKLRGEIEEGSRNRCRFCLGIQHKAKVHVAIMFLKRIKHFTSQPSNMFIYPEIIFILSCNPEFRFLHCRLTNVLCNRTTHSNHLLSSVLLNRRYIFIEVCKRTPAERNKRTKPAGQEAYQFTFNHTQNCMCSNLTLDLTKQQ